MTPTFAGLGIWSAELRFADPAEIPEAAAELEELGFSALWVPGAAGGPIFDDMERVLGATRSIPAATGIVNVWAHEPEETAARHGELRRGHPDRFLLGLGVSHKPLVDGLDLGTYEKPLQKMRGYLDALDAASPPVAAEERCLAALRPRMRELAAERSRGTHSYFVTPAHTRTARESMGPDALVAPEHTVVLETDPGKARDLARRFASTYLRLPNYVNNLLEYGYTEADVADGGSDRLIDDVVAWGSPDQIRERLQAHFDAGADHVCVQLIDPSFDPGALAAGRQMTLPRDGWRALGSVLS